MPLLSKCAFAAIVCLAAAPALAKPGPLIEVVQPWAPATPGGARTAAVYVTLTQSSAGISGGLPWASATKELTGSVTAGSRSSE